jgi:3-oxoadipate CoA-transferase beta subunit
MIDKTFESLERSIADIHDGATVMIGGFGNAGMPSSLIDALIAQGARDLTIVNNNAGNGETGLAALLKAKRVRKIICSFPRQADSHHFDALFRAGEIELELTPQGNLAERIRAAGAGIGGFFTPTGYGTLLAGGKEDGTQLRPDHGDGRQNHGRPGKRHRTARRTRSRNDHHPGHLRPARRQGGHRMSSTSRFNRDQMAERVARDIPEGAYVNLGIGLPTRVANYLPPEREVFLHSENGLLGMGPAPAPGEEDEDLINAGKQPVTLLTGGAYFHHADSFAMMRGGHLDICVLGAFQVSDKGDLANWHTGAPDAIPAVGGAMDLASGAKQVFVMMEHQTKTGESKIVERCSYPLTGIGCVSRIYTDLAVLDVTPRGLCVREMASGLTLADLQAVTAAPLLVHKHQE